MLTALKANPHLHDYEESFRNNRGALADTLIDLAEHAAAAKIATKRAQGAIYPANDVYNAPCLLSILSHSPKRTSMARRFTVTV